MNAQFKIFYGRGFRFASQFSVFKELLDDNKLTVKKIVAVLLVKHSVELTVR
jgi:hypothetical protein